MKKYLISTLMISGLMAALLLACQKNNNAVLPPPVLTADSLTYNTATHKFSPDSTVNGSLKGGGGIQLAYFYLVRSNAPDSLVYFDTTSAENRTDFSFNIPSSIFKDVDLSNATGVKVMVKLLDNSTFQGMIKIMPFAPPLPELKNFPDTLQPDLSGGVTPVSGDISSESGLQTIIIEDDYQGDFVAVDSITGLNGAKTYSLNYNYTYRKNASHLKIIAVDIFGLSTSFVITMPVLPYDVYKNVTMMGQGTSSAASANCFFLADGSLTGTCDITGREAEIDFLAYCNTSPAMYFYSPTNTANVAKNFKCSGVSWAPDATQMRATRFRVLVPGSSATDAIYAAYNANSIPNLDDDFFAGISAPSASSSKYDADESAAGASVFNLTSSFLIWARIPQQDGSFKNALIAVKSVNVVTDSGSQGLSTITFDIMKQQ